MAWLLDRITSRPTLFTAQWLCRLCVSCSRKYTTGSSLISEGDIVLLRRVDRDTSSPILTKPLSHGCKIYSHQGTLDHSNLIGKEVRDVVSFSRGVIYRIHWPTLAEYLRFTPRIVTPVYPGDANLIVSLLDIHTSCPTKPAVASSQKLTFEILEAGTGHGSLTLHLARAIHAANSYSLSSSSLSAVVAAAASSSSSRSAVLEDDRSGERKHHLEEVGSTAGQSEVSNILAGCYDANTELKERWKSERGAVIHTVDISAIHSAHARRVVRGFRRGLYAGSIDFYTGNVSEWIKEQLQIRQSTEPFLAHAVLDLPSTHIHLSNIASALRIDGILAVFNPSITQLTKCVEVIRQKRLPFVLDQVVELGGSTGGREWDVRVVKPRALLKVEKERRSTAGEQPANENQVEKEEEAVLSGCGATGSLRTCHDEKSRAEELAESSIEQGSGWEMICRPKVGDRVVGGGFLGLWRRMRDAKDYQI